ncbi:hypothetical protein ACGIJG_09100 [Lacticaseibacillus rhamnosus]|uniref:hypothetical protein n=1 Tax=Lacticaseibacillus rhamnosus TaxID=47715 RepID=UPI0022E6F1EC|nr:hypothetical protein [Lacticaseibacillus rhamnosus]
MKKWMMIATAFLALSGVSGAALYQQHVSAKSDVKTTTVKTVTKKTTNQPKATSKSQASSSSASSTAQTTSTHESGATVTVKTPATTTEMTTASSASTATDAAATTSDAAATTAQTASQPTVQAPFYVGTWHNERVSLTITATQMTISQNGVSKTSRYTATSNGNGYVLTPTDIEADAIYLVPVTGGVEWVAPGTTTPLILRP